MKLRFNTMLLLALLMPFGASAHVSMAITVAPPPLPDYAQPPSPGNDYIWSPGYWAWAMGSGDYYWVPGTWVQAPRVGELWTPGYWGYEGGGFFWHVGYWGATVGFYGGLNYGYGYNGTGYQGGHWNHRHFVYTPRASQGGPNTSHVSFNGGAGGSSVRAPAASPHPGTDEHHAPSDAQMQHERAAMTRPTQRASSTHEQFVAATPRPMAFEAPGVEHVRNVHSQQTQAHPKDPSHHER